MTKAVAYFRTSSAANVGSDKDSLVRQQIAVRSYAAANGIEIVSEYYDAAVSGADAIDQRKGFCTMLAEIGEATMIVVENASRFARDIIVQETGYKLLCSLGLTLVASDDPDAFTADTPTAIMVRQILGVVSAFEKANLVAKLAGARQRKREATGRCEGRKQAPVAARQLAQSLNSSGLSLRAIAAQLAEQGFVAPSGAVYGAQSVSVMLAA